ncbi:MAG TPA: hypothetical protein VN326_06825 [Casimicrobiaceae bacterium]|jgi:hypothetical protein|nr:hypothetical protein [Casimicrobiaceae bacterium]
MAKVKEPLAKLESMNDADAGLRICADIDRLETEADHVMRAA